MPTTASTPTNPPPTANNEARIEASLRRFARGQLHVDQVELPIPGDTAKARVTKKYYEIGQIQVARGFIIVTPLQSGHGELRTGNSITSDGETAPVRFKISDVAVQKGINPLNANPLTIQVPSLKLTATFRLSGDPANVSFVTA